MFRCIFLNSRARRNEETRRIDRAIIGALFEIVNAASQTDRGSHVV
jgi:hypothetical protein